MADMTILKKTPIHCTVKISGSAGAKTIVLATDLLFSAYETAATPIVNIMGLHWSIKGAEVASVVRNAKEVWTLTGAHGEVFNGWQDNQENASDIVITLPASGGTVVLELVKISGYGNTQHVNPQARI